MHPPMIPHISLFVRPNGGRSAVSGGSSVPAVAAERMKNH